MTLIEDETQQEYIVHLPEDVELPTDGEHIAVHFNGVIALSLPAQLSALRGTSSPMRKCARNNEQTLI